MNRNKKVKPKIIDAMLDFMNKAIEEKQYKIRSQTREALQLASKQRADREILHELMKRRSEYLKLKREAKE